jgi:MFS family permease
LSGIRRLLALISIAMVAETAAYSAITPLLPGLADEHDLSKAAAGVLAAAYPFGTLALALPAAWVSSRIGPKRTVLGALVLLGLSSLAFGLVGSTALLVLARLGQGVGGAAIWAGGLAWVVSVAPREHRGEAIGTAVGAAIAGALGGPAIGALAHALGTGVVFFVFFLVSLALASVVARQPGPAAVANPAVTVLREALTEPRMRRGMWLMVLPACAFGLFNVLVPLRLDDLGAGAVTIGAVFLIAVLFESLMSPLAGRLADRRGALWPARIGLAGGGVALALLPVPDVVVLVTVVLVVAASLLGMLWTPAMAVLSDGAEARSIDPAFGFGLGNLAWGVGAALGGSGGGALAGATTDLVPYVVLGATAVVTAVVLREPAQSSPPRPRPRPLPLESSPPESSEEPVPP